MRASFSSNGRFSVWLGGEVPHVAGVADVMEVRARLGVVMDGLPEGGAAILLAHEPDCAESGRFRLQLSGRSHGGR